MFSNQILNAISVDVKSRSIKNKRKIARLKRQHKKYGFNDTITWNLDIEVFKIMYNISKSEETKAKINILINRDLYDSKYFNDITLLYKENIDAFNSFLSSENKETILEFISFLHVTIYMYNNINCIDTKYEWHKKEIFGQNQYFQYWIDWLIERGAIIKKYPTEDNINKFFEVLSHTITSFWW